MKNAIDVGSRPYGQNVFNGKPAAIISQSIGAVGGFGATHHLRQSLAFLNMPTLQQPEAYLGHSAQLFDAAGVPTAPAVTDILRGYGVALADWIDRLAASSEATPDR